MNIIYHANCTDGFAAAFVAWLRYGDKANYYPATYGSPPPDMLMGSPVRILDFSYPRDTLRALQSRHPDTLVIDHHKTAQEALAGLPFCIFDMAHSGACLTWRHFYPDKPLPTLLAYVEDRDLWRFHLPDSKAISTYIRSFPHHFTEWEHHLWRDGTLHHHAAEYGYAILRFSDRLIDEMSERAQWRPLGGWTVPTVNATVLHSEVAHRLLANHPSAPFAACYFETLDKQGRRTLQWSLRGDGRTDVSEVAKVKGGGGHHNAAGFVEVVDNFLAMKML